MNESSHITVIRDSKYFTPDTIYPVLRWLDSCPLVHNNVGSKTWLTDVRSWKSVLEPMTLERSQAILHARWQKKRNDGME